MKTIIAYLSTATVFLAEGTVKNYVSRIMEKLHARNRTELAVKAATRRG